MTVEQRTADQSLPLVDRAWILLNAAYNALDDVLEDWQLHGMHQHPLYLDFAEAVRALRDAHHSFKKEGFEP